MLHFQQSYLHTRLLQQFFAFCRFGSLILMIQTVYLHLPTLITGVQFMFTWPQPLQTTCTDTPGFSPLPVYQHQYLSHAHTHTQWHTIFQQWFCEKPSSWKMNGVMWRKKGTEYKMGETREAGARHQQRDVRELVQSNRDCREGAVRCRRAAVGGVWNTRWWFGAVAVRVRIKEAAYMPCADQLLHLLASPHG